jgi:drug/metabolite transporter (DMT)-like permease
VSAQLKVAIGLALAGLFLVSQVWSGFAFDLVGVAAGLLLAVALAAFWILGESGQQHRDPVSLTMWGFAWATLVWSVALPWWSFPWDVLGRVADPIGVGLPNLPVWAIMAGGIAFGTVVPFLLVLGSLRRIGAQRAGIVGTTEPLWAFLLGFIILGEVVAPIQILGVGLVLAGVLVAELSRNPGPAPGVERTDHRRRVPDSLATGAQSVPPRP